jgi:hypothetical protein
LPTNYIWRRNKRTFDGKQEFEYAPNMPSGDEILRQLEGMIFGDESVGKEPKPTEKSKTDSKKTKKNKRSKRRPLRKDNQ